jgi:hypothetical protein
MTSLVIPLAFDGKPAGWQKRYVANGKTYRKYQFSKGLPKGGIIYNYDAVRKTSCVLVEGVFDCAQFHDVGIAAFGITPSQRQLQLISSKFRNSVVMFDDDAKWKAINVARQLRLYNVDAYVCMPSRSPADHALVDLIGLPLFDPVDYLLSSTGNVSAVGLFGQFLKGVCDV